MKSNHFLTDIGLKLIQAKLWMALPNSVVLEQLQNLRLNIKDSYKTLIHLICTNRDTSNAWFYVSVAAIFLRENCPPSEEKPKFSE